MSEHAPASSFESLLQPVRDLAKNWDTNIEVLLAQCTQRSLEPMDVTKAVAHGPHKSEVNEYTNRDVIIYALGVGATGADEVQYLYENDPNFCAIPTFVAAQGLKEIPLTEWPGVEPELTRILHGEEFIEVFAPIPTDGKIRSEVKVVDVLDKESGAVILYEVTTFNAESDEKIARQQCSIFQKGSGSFGGCRKSPHEIPALAPPQRDPDQCLEQKTEINQASLYRLGSGDLNPLHIDREFAKLSGFDQPILHGMCSLGFSVRHVLKTYAGNNVTFFRNLKARFSGVVLPGQTLCTQMWKEGNRIHFETLVKETGKKAISSAYVDLNNGSFTGGEQK